MPVVVFVVAADGGWMPQSAEHLAAVDALGVRHGLLVVSRADLADPGPAREQALEQLGGTSLRDAPAVSCSVVTGDGLEDVRRELAQVLARVPAPDTAAPVRFWIDRSFSVTGAGTVVTGTLSGGTVGVGDELLLGDRTVHVRGVQTLERDTDRVAAVARVALNLRGVDRRDVGRGDALLTAGTHLSTDVADVRLVPAHGVDGVPAQAVAHLGSAAVPVRTRVLAPAAGGAVGPDGGGAAVVRLQLGTALPLRVGDRLLLRDPARHEVLGAAVVLDVEPPSIRRRGAAAVRAQDLAGAGAGPVAQLRRRRLATGGHLRAMGIEPPGKPVAGDWYADPEFWTGRGRRLRAVVAEFAAANPLQPGPTLEQVRRALDLPGLDLVAALVAPPLRVHDGRVVERTDELPARVERSVTAVLTDLQRQPFAAPDAERLRELQLGRAELAAAVRAGRLERVAEGVVLAPGFRDRAVVALRAVPQPFTLGEARRALGTSRRVAVPLLEALDAAGLTARDADDHRRLTGR